MVVMFKMIVAAIKMAFFMVLSSYVFNEFRWIAAHDGIRGHILSNHGSSGHDSVLADSHARQDGGTSANPSVFADVDGLAEENLAVVEVVVVGDELRIGSNHRAVVDGDTAATHHQAVVHDHYILPDVYMMEADSGKAWHHPAAFIEVVAEELAHESVVLVGVGHRVVQFEKDLRLAHAFRVFFGCGQPGVNSLFLHRCQVLNYDAKIQQLTGK
jgi:hypothetical protein